MAGHRKSVDVELTIISARDLKNVNWRYGDLRAYAVAWVDPDFKASTEIDREGDTNPCWNEKLNISVSKPIEDAELQIDIVHNKPLELTKPLIGTARISLREVLDEVGFDEKLQRTLKLKRPSGRPHGKLEVAVRVREKRWAEPQYPPPGGYPQAYGTRDYVPPQQGYARNYPSQQYQYGYAPPPPSGYPVSAPAYGSSYAQPGPYGAYGGNNYSNQGDYGYGGSGSSAPVYEKPKSSKYGVGTGLAVGAVAGVLGGLALAEGVDYVEDKIADDAAERVEENEVYDDDY